MQFHWSINIYGALSNCLNYSWYWTHAEGRLNSILGPRSKQCTGVPTYTTTHGNETVNVDQIKHIFIVFQLNQCLRIKKLDLHNIRTLAWCSWIFIVLAHWNNSPLVDMSLHSDTLLISSQTDFVLTPYCCVLRGETANTNFIVFGLTWRSSNRR